jgi:acyl-coenzyme A synthetase/AMP-(fatty) acid ligase
MNFATDVVEAAEPGRLALVELPREGARREWSFGEVARRTRTVAAWLDDLGLARGDTVLTLIGNRPEWVLTMVACFRQGFVVLPCTEQLRAKDLRLRRPSSPTAATPMPWPPRAGTARRSGRRSTTPPPTATTRRRPRTSAPSTRA